jgi:hypothetical protein
MKNVNWIIEKNLFDDYENKLVEAINKNGSNCILYDNDRWNSDLKKDLSKLLKDDDIVIFHGSLGLGKKMLRETSYYPGIYLTLESYECFKYYGYYGDNLLNNNYLMFGLNDVLRNKNFIFNIFNSEKIFIRPSNGYKTFTGQCLSKINFEKDFDLLIKSYGGIDLDTLCLISPAQDIEEEYRLVIVDKKIISGSLYMDSKNRESWIAYYDKLCEDVNVFKFAESLIEMYQPDFCFDMDICRLSNGDYKLIEINSFCCGSMYGNDYEKVVSAVNDMCLKDYNDIF